MRLVSNTTFQSSLFMRSASPSLVIPALLTRISIRPNSLAVAANACLMESSDARSSSTTYASFDRERISAATCSSLSLRRAASATRAPASASASAQAFPMPPLAPVTNATLLCMYFDDSKKESCLPHPTVASE